MTGEYSELIQSTEVMRRIVSDVKSKRLAHAYLVVSEDEVGIDALFAQIAYTMFCSAGGCGECAECARIRTANHADVHVLRPQDGKKQILVPDVERMVEDCYRASFTGGYKLYLIPQADRMNAQAQNKFLKTLEEPPKNVVFFLGTGTEGSLLSTVKSRTEKIYLPPFSSSELSAALGGSVRAKLAAAYSGGILTRALKMMASDGYAQLTDGVFEILTSLKKSSDVAKFVNDTVFSKENFPDALTVLETIFNDVLLLGVGKEEKLSFFDKREKIEELLESYGVEAVAAILPLLTDARRRLSVNCNLQGVVDNLLYTILEVRHKCRP